MSPEGAEKGRIVVKKGSLLVPNVLHTGEATEESNRVQAVMLKLVNVIPAMILCTMSLCGQEVEKAPPKELLQYVQDAQKAGLNANEIQQNALNAGWPAPTVTEAMAYLKSAEKEKPKTEAEAKTATPGDNTAAAVVARTDDGVNTPGNPKPAATPAPAATDTGAAPGSVPPAVKETKTTAPATGPATAAGGSNTPSQAVANALDDYKIGAGDVLKITVWHEPDASLPSAVVLPSGRISVPLLHEVEVVGLTVPQLEKLLAERFSTLINAPEVSVVVTGMNSKKIYMTGKVKREGPLPYVYEMTVMQALTEAGGVTDYAKKKNIYVLRTENGKQFKLPFDYAAVLRGEHLETNIQLIPGDMIVVP